MYADHFDCAKIERYLLDGKLESAKLASRFFSKSFQLYSIENPKPAKIFSDDPKIHCEYCNASLFDEGKRDSAIFVVYRECVVDGKEQLGAYVKAYFSCKGTCDDILDSRYSCDNLFEVFNEISEYLTPTGFRGHLMFWMESQQAGDEIKGEAFDKLKRLLYSAFPYVTRQLTSEEKKRASLFFM